MPEYERISTTFPMDFAIADHFGEKAVRDTYRRAFAEWKTNYQYLTELAIALNDKAWEHYHRGNSKRSELYSSLYYKAHHYACSHLKGEELDYYWHLVD